MKFTGGRISELFFTSLLPLIPW